MTSEQATYYRLLHLYEKAVAMAEPSWTVVDHARYESFWRRIRLRILTVLR